MKPLGQGEPGSGSPPASDDHLFTTFAYNSTSKRLTMIPFRYKVKEERRKVLKISVNKLKKIDDPESWLCRSVLINNTMKKLQKEARDEKMNKQVNAGSYAKSYATKTSEFGCQLNNNNNKSSNNNNISDSNNSGNNNNNVGERVYSEGEETDCFYRKPVDDSFYGLSDVKSEEFLFEARKEPDGEGKEKSKVQPSENDDDRSPMSSSVSINEDFVDKIPSIKRCVSRKKSVDEDVPPGNILELGKGSDADEVDECDVHDVLSQLYMPPTPRMLTSIDSDTDDDELNVVDIDSSYIDNLKDECQKLPGDDLFGVGDGGGVDDRGGGGLAGCEKRGREDDETGTEEGSQSKKRKLDDVFSWCGESYDNFLCSNRNKECERTSGEGSREAAPAPAIRSHDPEEELIELEDEEDIKRRLSQSLAGHYGSRKPEKASDGFFDDGCDNQYSCGHTVTMFGDIQSVTFHNLIASLET